MPKTQQKKAQPAPEVRVSDPPSPPSAKARVEQMFGGDAQAINTEHANDPPKQIHIEATLDLPAHADPQGDKTAKDAKDAVDALINSLGTDKLPQTCFPVAKSKNNGKAAAEFVLWDHVARRANKILESAAAQAEREGVFGDPSEYVEGEATMTFNSAEYAISVKKNAGSKMIDKALVEAVLREVAPNKWQELYDRCFKPRAGAAMRIVSLK